MGDLVGEKGDVSGAEAEAEAIAVAAAAAVATGSSSRKVVEPLRPVVRSHLAMWVILLARRVTFQEPKQ